MNPKDALQRLIDGNSRFVSGQTTSHNAAIDRATMSEGQAPFAAVLRCADSRVSPEIVFDQPLGNLFVCAVAGNVPTPEIVESLEYAVGQLSCPLIVVMGHTNCGAVAHATAHLPTKGLFSMIDIPHDDEDAIAFNAEQGIPKIMVSSDMIQEAVKIGQVQIIAGVYDIGSGQFELVAQTTVESA